jgi:hypothetical protein
MAKDKKRLDDTPAVNDYMSQLEHPLKAEAESLRAIILNTDTQISEGIKWNSPSFYYKGDMVVFHLRNAEHVHLIFPSGVNIADDTGLLEGDYPDGRKMSYFRSMDEVNAKKASLESVMRQWMKFKDQ